MDARVTRRRPWVLRVWGNPLARSSDRTEALVLIGLIAVWVLSLPLVATVASAEWSTIAARVSADQNRAVAVDAVLVDDAPPTVVDPRSPAMVPPTAAGTWVGRDGVPAAGAVPVPAGARAGDHVTIWLDAAGTVVDPPMTTPTAAGILVAGAATAWFVLGLTFAAGWRGLRWLFDRRRSRSWTDEWAAFDAGRPTGTGGSDGPG